MVGWAQLVIGAAVLAVIIMQIAARVTIEDPVTGATLQDHAKDTEEDQQIVKNFNKHHKKGTHRVPFFRL